MSQCPESAAWSSSEALSTRTRTWCRLRALGDGRSLRRSPQPESMPARPTNAVLGRPPKCLIRTGAGTRPGSSGQPPPRAGAFWQSELPIQSVVSERHRQLPWTGGPVQEHTVERDRRSGHKKGASGTGYMVCLDVRRAVSVLEDSSERFRSFLISFWDEVRVHVEGRDRVPMTQSPCDSTDVDTRREKSRRHVVP